MADGQVNKPSRYHSQRKAPTSVSPTAPGPGDGGGVSRSRSRYHHNRPATSHAQDQPDDPSGSTRSIRSREHLRDADAGAPNELDEEDSERAVSRHKTSEKSRSPQRADPRRFYDAPTLVRAKAEAFVPEAEAGDIPLDEPAGCFGLFKRKKQNTRPVTSTKRSPAPRPAASKPGEPLTIRPGGGGVVPGTDAPLSASNAGERRVLVECNQQSIFLPVGPTTTASDLITSASNCLLENIDARASALLEHFVSVGVQRPVRRYEHVKDVMNSWDDDRANSFLVVPSRAIDVNLGGLSAINAPREKPAKCSFLMHYSQKPGHWDKRLVTVREDGQIVMSKGSKDSEATNICHLSDFDIYTPTATQISKKIKPPKKICFAIKSQQKTSMFLSTSTYVHFFCTAERTLGNSFYDAVQGWRSWYLVNVMGEGKKPKTTGLGRSSSKATKHSSHHPHVSTGSTDTHYQLGSYKPLVDLAQFDKPTSSSGQATSNGLNGIPSRKLSTRDRNHASNALPKAQLADDEPLVNLVANRRSSLDNGANDQDAFMADGLLGRSYSTRQRQVAEREAAAKNPWINGHVHLQGLTESSLERQTSIKRTASNRRPTGAGAHDLRHRPSTRDRERVLASGDIKRSGSTRAKEMPKPLVDLTPTYKPPPQHVKKGKGFYPDEVGPGGLIDNATSPEQAYYIPSSTDWRGRANATPVAGDAQAESRSRSAADRISRPANAGDQAFTGTGLLSASHGGYTGKPSVGRGVMSGDRNAAKPMLDVSEESNYAPGSLLSKVAKTEREAGRAGPTFDRGS